MFTLVNSTRTIRAAVPTLALLAGVIACSDSPTQTHTITAAQLQALPRLSTTDGPTLCVSATQADTLCPLRVATGNWLGDSTFAVWETGRPVNVWSGGKRTILISKDTAEASQYTAALAVGPGRSKDEAVVVDPVAGVEHRFKLDGEHIGARVLAPMSMLSVWGYYGASPVWYVMETSSDRLTADVVIKVGKEIGDSNAREAFRANLPWAHLLNGSFTIAPPFFPNAVSYAFTPEGDAIWSDGTRFVVRREKPNHHIVWVDSSDIAGPDVDSIDVAKRIADITSQGSGVSVPADQLDSMKVKTKGTKHPAINGILLAPNGSILVARTFVPQVDSIEYIRMGNDGTPNARLMLDKGARPVLFAGDSLLVHRTLNGQPRTLLWLVFKGGK